MLDRCHLEDHCDQSRVLLRRQLVQVVVELLPGLRRVNNPVFKAFTKEQFYDFLRVTALENLVFEVVVSKVHDSETYFGVTVHDSRLFILKILLVLVK